MYRKFSQNREKEAHVVLVYFSLVFSDESAFNKTCMIIANKLWNNSFDAACYGFHCNLIIAIQQWPQILN